MNKRSSISYGFLTVSKRPSLLVIEYGGNMGNNERHAAKCFNKLFGEESWSRLRPLASKWGGKNQWFDYYWSAHIPEQNWPFRKFWA